MGLTKYLVIGIGVLLLALGAAGWLLKNSYEANGALQLSVDSLTKANKAKTDATQSRAKTDDAVRRMAPADKRDKLR